MPASAQQRLYTIDNMQPEMCQHFLTDFLYNFVDLLLRYKEIRVITK